MKRIFENDMFLGAIFTMNVAIWVFRMVEGPAVWAGVHGLTTGLLLSVIVVKNWMWRP